MLSPVVAKIKEGNQTIYFTPLDTQLEKIINNNSFIKYKAFYDIEPATKLKYHTYPIKEKLFSNIKAYRLINY